MTDTLRNPCARGRAVNFQADSIIDRGYIAPTERLSRPHIRRTPTIEADAADFGLVAARLSFKLELLQHAGSFKTRGAFANLLTREIPQAGVVAASGGNRGAAVAYATMKLAIPAKIFVPAISSPAKVQRIRNYRAELVVTGERYDRAGDGGAEPRYRHAPRRSWRWRAYCRHCGLGWRERQGGRRRTRILPNPRIRFQ